MQLLVPVGCGEQAEQHGHRRGVAELADGGNGLSRTAGLRLVAAGVTAGSAAVSPLSPRAASSGTCNSAGRRDRRSAAALTTASPRNNPMAATCSAASLPDSAARIAVPP